MAVLATQKKITAVAVAQGGTFTSDIEITNQKCASVQFSKTGLGKGTAKLQWSNDGQNWKDVNTTLYPEATAAVAAGGATVHLQCEVLLGAWARMTFTEDGTGAVAVTGGRWIAKTH